MNNYRENNQEFKQEVKEHSVAREYADYREEQPVVDNSAKINNNYYDNLLYYNVSEQAEPVSKTIPAPKTQSYSEIDSLPSQTTMQFINDDEAINDSKIKTRNYTYEYEESRIKDENDRQYKINAKAKVLIAIYALVVVTIFALIIINTRLLRTMNVQISSYQTQIEQLNNQREQLNIRLKNASSNETVEKWANENNMIKQEG